MICFVDLINLIYCRNRDFLYVIRAFNFANSACKTTEKYAKLSTSLGLVELSARSVHEETTSCKGQRTLAHTNLSFTASNILPFSKFLTLELDVHKNRQLQITAPSMSYLCQLLTINGFGSGKARRINPACASFSTLLILLPLRP